MASSFSNLCDNLSEGNQKNNCKYGHGNKNMKNGELNTKIVSVILNKNWLKMDFLDTSVHVVT